jgi:hypothetical protein
MAVKKLTAGFVREARAEPGKERTVYWDATLPSFGLMVTAAGHRSWVLQYRSGQVSRRYTINSVLGLEDARREARAVLGLSSRQSFLSPMLRRNLCKPTVRQAYASYPASQTLTVLPRTQALYGEEQP